MTFRACRFSAGWFLGFSLAVLPALARGEESPTADKSAAPGKSAPSDKSAAPDKPAAVDKSAATEKTDDADKARTLFREGRALASSGQYDEACSKFEQSFEIEKGIGTEFNWADCLEHTGKLKKAQSMFLVVADAAHEKGQDDREKVARDRARALDDKLPKLGVDVKEMADGLQVLVDGAAIDRTHWATGERIDPGAHDIEARAPHKKAWSLHVEVPAGPAKMTITVPKLDDEPTKVTPAAEHPEQTPPPKEAAHAREEKPTTVRQTAKVFLLGGAGVGVLLAGTGLAMYKLSNDNAKDVCPSSVDCTPDDVHRHDEFLHDAAFARALGYIGLGLTGASFVGFTVLTLTAPPNREAPRTSAAFAAAPLVGGGAWGASVRGRF